MKRRLTLQSDLMAAGFDVRAIRPPSVAPGTARLRVTVRYPVSDADLHRFAGERRPPSWGQTPVLYGVRPQEVVSRFS